MKKLVLVDGYSLLYRAYHALQMPMRAPDGTPTNAIHGFMMMLMKVLGDEKPDGVAVAFDLHAPTFRAQIYADYKGTRKPMPDDMRPQVPVLRELIARMEIPILECEGYEADDILGTASRVCEGEDAELLLVTGDRDSFQLAGGHTAILYTKKGIAETQRVTPEYIRESYGVEPKQLIDVKALMGDTSDNIPGIAGVGEKTALKLVQKYETLENVLLRGAAEEKGRLAERLRNGADMARMSYRLAEINRHAPVELKFDDWKLGAIAAAIPRARELGMNIAAKRMAEIAQALCLEGEATPAPEAAQPLPEPVRVDGVDALRALFADDIAPEWAAVHMDSEISVATAHACAVMPLGGDLLSVGVSAEAAAQAVSDILNRAKRVELWNAKVYPIDDAFLADRAFDVMLAAYAVDPQRASFEAESLCAQAGIQGYARCPAAAIHRLAELLRAALVQNDLEKIYRDIEYPLSRVLRDMEREGFMVDADALRALGAQFDARIARLTEEIAAEMGAAINLNSPKQLGETLFEKMGLPAPKKTKRGYSTSAEVLEELAEDYPICAKILEYRKYQKLRSTYIDSLIALRDADGRVHTHFEQVATATGRLSSTEPNLQNIPVRTEIGREIRGAFVAKPGCVLIDADYSQIELRVLAHVSGDETMIRAFNAGEDIHARTAAEVYGVPLDAVTSQMRSSCKAVNFGIVYGISDFALAKSIGTSRREAREFMDRYFERYPGVRAYMDSSVREGRERGYALTLMGRRRYLPELASANFNVRSFGERCAMNSPIQGTAADIIKLAMIRTAEALRESGLKARLILQVHDELILEAPEAEADRAGEILRDCMENVLALSVPLKTEIQTGVDWRACK